MKASIPLMCLALGFGSTVAATPPPQVAAPVPAPACQKEVKDYLNALVFVRQSSGTSMGTRVEQAFLNEKDLNQLVAERGPCAAAQALRQRGALR